MKAFMCDKYCVVKVITLVEQENKKYNDMEENDPKYVQPLIVVKLQRYLLKEGIIRDPNWVDNYLKPEFKEAMIHLRRMS